MLFFVFWFIIVPFLYKVAGVETYLCLLAMRCFVPFVNIITMMFIYAPYRSLTDYWSALRLCVSWHCWNFNLEII